MHAVLNVVTSASGLGLCHSLLLLGPYVIRHAAVRYLPKHYTRLVSRWIGWS